MRTIDEAYNDARELFLQNPEDRYEENRRLFADSAHDVIQFSEVTRHVIYFNEVREHQDGINIAVVLNEGEAPVYQKSVMRRGEWVPYFFYRRRLNSAFKAAHKAVEIYMGSGACGELFSRYYLGLPQALTVVEEAGGEPDQQV